MGALKKDMLYSEWKSTKKHRTVGHHQKVGMNVLCDSGTNKILQFLTLEVTPTTG